MVGPADYSFEGTGPAPGAFYIHFIMRSDKEFFKQVAALQAAKFKNRHCLFPPVSAFGRWLKSQNNLNL